MRCSVYCTSASYNIGALFEYLKPRYATTLYKDSLQIPYTQDGGEVFFFSYGVMVFWGLSEEEEYQMIDRVKSFEIEPLSAPIRDFYDFSYGEANRIQRDEIILSNKDTLTKLAVGYGLAQSAKLAVFEETIDKTIAKTKYLPRDLAIKGKIFLSRKEISQKIGELFIDRSSVNLHSEILDEPDFFWEYPEHHPLYRDTAKCLDMRTRIEVLNNRLAILGELLQILNDQLNHQHSSTLEWTIIWLIVIEVILAILKDIFHFI
jgi:uncharacterized Rmd1/YagE family protein